MDQVQVPGCKATMVRDLHTNDGLQILLVEVAPGGEIPLHQHNCAATMVITKGSAQTVGKNGLRVAKGDVVVKRPNEPHGFTDVSEDFAFVSISDGNGIMHDGSWDMTF